MDDYIKRLRQYGEANPTLFDGEWDHPAMDFLYWRYSESHYMGNEKTKEIIRELNDRLEELSFRENNRVFSLVGSLCDEHERIALLDGLQLGAQLMLELMEETVQDWNSLSLSHLEAAISNCKVWLY